MESYEAIATAINRDTVKQAKALGLSTSLLAKWQEPSTDFTDSGAYNPLDRILTIMKTSQELGTPLEAALAPLLFLAQSLNCAIIPLPSAGQCLNNVTKQLYRVIKEFGDLIKESSDAIKDGRITPDERRRVEKEGQQLLYHLGLFLKLIQEAAK